MGASGNLRTMALPDLLQWAHVNRKTGTLELQRNRVRRSLALRDGTIVACAFDDATLLAQYLLTASKVTPEILHDLLARMRATGRPLAEVVVEKGIVTPEELREQLTARAEETIYSLFDWMDATFRFDELGVVDDSWTEVEIDVDAILLNGLQRLDEVKMIRNVFQGSGIVLERTQKPSPEQIANSGMARRILASIDGRATLADVLVKAQASEFLVLNFLYHLFRKDVIAIRETRPAAPGAATLIDEIELADVFIDVSDVSEVAGAPAPILLAEPSEFPTMPELVGLAEAANMFAEAPVVRVSPESAETDQEVEIPASLAAAVADLMADAGMGFPTEPEIDVPYAVEVDFRAGDATSLPNAPTEPEPDGIRLDLALDRVPVLLREVGSLIDENLSAESCMLVQLIGAQMDIAAILGIAPLSEEAVFAQLSELAGRGIIDVRDPSDD